MSQRTDPPGLTAESGALPARPVEAVPSANDRWRFGKRPRQTRVVIRKVGPWSVFKFSVIFYLCVMLVLLLAFGMLYWLLGALGAIDSVTRLARDLFADDSFEIHGDWLFTRLGLIGLAMVVVWSLINVFVAFLYNLISDVVGGIDVTLSERR
ncbi:MAG TPA: DUF3566 domain-containing protein [Actinomycetota bacterium]|jgi:hypothetical protein|nr:DUF3566 domain-containing protein [Actinomycetota bacterium]